MAENPETCDYCGEEIVTGIAGRHQWSHEQICRARHDSPFSSARESDDEDDESCTLCGQDYDSYLDHIERCESLNEQ